MSLVSFIHAYRHAKSALLVAGKTNEPIPRKLTGRQKEGQTDPIL